MGQPHGAAIRKPHPPKPPRPDSRSRPRQNTHPQRRSLLSEKTAQKKSCQVDLLLRTRQSLYLIEIKLRKTITKSVIDEVEEKITRLKLSKPRSCRTVLIYHGHLEPGLKEEDFFDYLIPFEDLMLEL